jgi:hypothetical protein
MITLPTTSLTAMGIRGASQLAARVSTSLRFLATARRSVRDEETSTRRADGRGKDRYV